MATLSSLQLVTPWEVLSLSRFSSLAPFHAFIKFSLFPLPSSSVKLPSGKIHHTANDFHLHISTLLLMCRHKEVVTVSSTGRMILKSTKNQKRVFYSVCVLNCGSPRSSFRSPLLLERYFDGVFWLILTRYDTGKCFIVAFHSGDNFHSPRELNRGLVDMLFSGQVKFKDKTLPKGKLQSEIGYTVNTKAENITARYT